MSFPQSNPRQQRGMALLVALLIFAICATLLVAMQRDFNLDLRRGANRFIAEQSWAYMRGGEEMATLALQVDFDFDQELEAEQRRDHCDDIWAQTQPPFNLDEGGWLQGLLFDLQGRFNLNNLGDSPPENGNGVRNYTAAEQTFIRLLQALDGVELTQYQAEAIADSVGDWIDEDQLPRPSGAENDFYVAMAPAYRPANRHMHSVSELRAVANMTPEIYAALAPLVTVWPRQSSSPINIHTAPLEVLRAINSDNSLQPLSPGDGEALFQKRVAEGFESREEFLKEAVFAGSSMAKAGTLLTERSNYFLLITRVDIADRSQGLYSVLRRDQRQVTVLERTGASLYDLEIYSAKLSQACPDVGGEAS